ncbi:MAG TPA: hypothetical protein VFA18_03740 [Gemmataceae bacterium]|nr:hypothetical protein [Gemmataceae bacterium]
MDLNAYGVLDAFVTCLRLGLGLAVVALGVPAWWKWRTADSVERRRFFEDRSYLLFLLATVLLVLNFVSWPLFYLLLQSFVSQMRVMCIYGVTKFGTGSLSASRFLPGILTALEALKPFLIFLTGAWFVLYLLNRSTRTAPLMPRVLLAVILLGAVAVVDSTAEATYLAIPKTEDFESSGCCMDAFDAQERASSRLPRSLVGEHYGPWLWGLFYGVSGGMGLALLLYLRRPAWQQSGLRLVLLAVGASLSLAVALVFLVEIAAPKLLGLPHHHCPYDLVPHVPQSIPAIALYVLGGFAAGWACITGWFGRSAEAMPYFTKHMRSVLALSLVGYTASVGMLSVELFGMPLLTTWLQRPESRCALDGVAIDPLYAVRIVEDHGSEHPFCCIRCASVWLKQQPEKPREIFVTDETSGTEIPAASAFFVRSFVVTTPTTGNRIHAFKARADAVKHADAANGTLLEGAERPFGQDKIGSESPSNRPPASGPPHSAPNP